MKMKYTEQAVETLDDAGSVIANKNIEIEQLRQRVSELEKEQVAWRKFIERANNTVSAAEAKRDELLKACDALLEWDFVRGFRLPYKVRDPIIAAIKEMK